MLLGYWGNNKEERNRLNSMFNKNVTFNAQFSVHFNDNELINSDSDSGDFRVLVVGNIYNIGQIVFQNNAINLPSEFILKQISNGNNDFFKDINGEFLLIILNKKENTLQIYRDQIGVMPLYYYQNKDSLYFSTHIKTLIKNIKIQLEIEEKWFLNGFFKINENKHITNYKNIYRLSPSHFLKFINNRIIIEKYWELTKVKLSSQKSEAEYLDEFRKLLINAVEKRIKPYENIGCELSGGIDSSTVTCISAMATEKNAKKIYAYSHTLADEAIGKIFPFKDERKFSKIISDAHSNICHNFISLKEHSLLDLMREFIIDMGFVPINNYNKYIIEPIKIGKQNDIKILLSGFGGDELVSYKGLHYIGELIHNVKFREAKKYFNQYCSYNKYGKIRGLVTLFVKIYFFRVLNFYKKLLKKKSVRNLLNIIIFSNINELIYQSKKIERSKTLNMVLLNKIANHRLLLRIEASSEYSLLKGINYVFPLLDIDLIQYYFSLPSEIKVNPNETRHIIRQAIKGIVPEEIRTRNDKSGSSVPSVQYSYLKDYDKITEFILHCKNNLKEHYINYDTMLEWHKLLKNREKNKKTVRMGDLTTILQFLVFQDLFERDKILDNNYYRK